MFGNSGIAHIVKAMGVDPDELMRVVQQFAQTAKDAGVALEKIKASQYRTEVQVSQILTTVMEQSEGNHAAGPDHLGPEFDAFHPESETTEQLAISGPSSDVNGNGNRVVEPVS